MAGLFETIRVREGRIPFVAEHLARLGAGLWRLGLAAAPPGLELRLRQLAAQGEVVARVTIDAAGEVIVTRPVPEADAVLLSRVSVKHPGYPIKSVERDPFDRAKAQAAAAGADEALLLTPDGYLAEGSFTSLFFWSDDLLCTPGLGLGILPGIGRARVISLAMKAGIPVAEGRFAPAALGDGAPFLVNAVRGILRVASLDGAAVRGDPRSGELAAQFWG